MPFFLLLPGIWMLGYASICGSVLSGKKRPGSASVLAGGAALLTLVLDLILIPPFGAEGAAVASTVAYAFFGISSLILVGRVLGTSPLRLLLVAPGEARGYCKAAVARIATLHND